MDVDGLIAAKYVACKDFPLKSGKINRRASSEHTFTQINVAWPSKSLYIDHVLHPKFASQQLPSLQLF